MSDAIRLIDLLARVPRETERRVRAARDHWRGRVQEALRAECRLSLRAGDDLERGRPAAAQIPLELAPGHPAHLGGITFSANLARILVLTRHQGTMRRARDGLQGLQVLREQLARMSDPDRWVQVTGEDLERVLEWSRFLLQQQAEHDPVQALLGVDQDILGFYQCEGDLLGDDRHANKATVRLYWAVIALAAEWLGSEVEALTLVAMVHELAHGYTQLGADIDGRRWPARDFLGAEPALVEGLAQYYTQRTLGRLRRDCPGALRVFLAMLPRQPSSYRVHARWISDYSPEAVRQSMLEVRRGRERTLEAFEARLARAQQQLRPVDPVSPEDPAGPDPSAGEAPP